MEQPTTERRAPRIDSVGPSIYPISFDIELSRCERHWTAPPTRSMIVDIHAHYVSPRLIGEAARNGADYGVLIEQVAQDRERLGFTADGVRLRPFFAALCSLRARLPYLDAQAVDVQVVSTWTDMAGDQLPAKQGARWARLQNETLAAGGAAAGRRVVAMG